MLYVNTNSCVRWAVGESDSFSVKVGVHQWLALSPLLFILVMDTITRVKVGDTLDLTVCQCCHAHCHYQRGTSRTSENIACSPQPLWPLSQCLEERVCWNLSQLELSSWSRAVFPLLGLTTTAWQQPWQWSEGSSKCSLDKMARCHGNPYMTNRCPPTSSPKSTGWWYTLLHCMVLNAGPIPQKSGKPPQHHGDEHPQAVSWDLPSGTHHKWGNAKMHEGGTHHWETVGAVPTMVSHLVCNDPDTVANVAYTLQVAGKHQHGPPKQRWMDCLKANIEYLGAKSADARDRRKWRTLIQGSRQTP